MITPCSGHDTRGASASRYVGARPVKTVDRPREERTEIPVPAIMTVETFALGHRRFVVAGHDTGTWIGYALAADHPDRLDRLAVAEAAMPGVSPSPPLCGTTAAKDRLWHFAFNRLAEVNEQLVHGREDVYFGFQFAKAANKLPDDAVRYYIEALAADPDALRGSFAAYRALDATIAQNQQRKTRRLTQPVLAIGGAEGIGEGAANTMRLAADDVQSTVIPGCGHYCLEEVTACWYLDEAVPCWQIASLAEAQNRRHHPRRPRPHPLRAQLRHMKFVEITSMSRGV